MSKVTSTNINEPWNSQLSSSIHSPGVEHVGEQEIRLQVMEELLVLVLENGESLVDFGDQIPRSVGVEALYSFWQPNLFTWELDNVGSNSVAAVTVAIDRALENGGSGCGGDYGDINTMNGKEPSYVYYGNEVTG